MAETPMDTTEALTPQPGDSVSVGMVEETVSAEFVPTDEDAKPDEAMNMATPAADSPDLDSVNGVMANGNNHVTSVDLDDDPNNEELTPPPDTPDSLSPDISPVSPSHLDEPMSRSPSEQPNALEDEKDEIVVGSNKHLLQKSSPPHGVSESADVDMDDIEDASVTSQKRKRSLLDDDVAAEDVPSPAPRQGRQGLPDARPHSFNRPQKAHGANGVKGTLLGYWRESPPKDPKDKHGVIGFIDSRDRLRTRIQTMTRDGRSIIHEYPLPPGPGGSWVTFQQVAFDPHLVNLNQHQVKEYVKVRVETERQDETPKGREAAEKAAVQEALRRIQENPPPPAATEPLVAYGTEIPEHALPQNRPEAKKRKVTAAAAQQATWAVSGVQPAAQSQPSQLDNLPGSRPTRILIGYWKGSSEKDPRDKHAVCGVLGANDMFRVKVMKETRDGRALRDSNFPTGAGGLWIQFEDTEFEPHLRMLSRQEVKEYVRVRQAQIDAGERPEDKVGNETKAVYEAQQRVKGILASGGKRDEYKREDHGAVPIAMKSMAAANGNGYDDSHSEVGLQAGSNEYPPLEPRPRGPRARLSMPDMTHRPPANNPVLERVNDLARREVDRLEAATMRQEQRQMDRQHAYGSHSAASTPPPPNSFSKSNLDSHMSRLNRVWATQEATRMKGDSEEDAKIYGGIKYERKKTGPFEGKLVSQGAIISIDGEDYVEYRVLTKPTFF